MGTTRADNTQGTPTHSHISPNILVYEDDSLGFRVSGITGEVTLHAEGEEEGHASSSFASILTSDDTRGGPEIFGK